MRKQNIFRRFNAYCQKHGLIRTFRRIWEYLYKIIFKSQEILFYADMNKLTDTVLDLPYNITIELRSAYDEAVQPDMQRMVDYWNEEQSIDLVKERFRKGAILWMVKVAGIIAGFLWSIRGKMVSPYHLPLTPNDAVIFDVVTFEEFRGRGLYPMFLDFVFGKLKAEGVSRVYGHSFIWNKSSIKGLNKSYYRQLSKTRKFHIFGRNITIWSQVDE
jgi:hypothetical protein